MSGAARALHWRVHGALPRFAARAVVGRPRKSCTARRDGDRPLQLWAVNEEFLVSAGHQPALITSLPFVHTARRYYRLGVLVSCLDVARRFCV